MAEFGGRFGFQIRFVDRRLVGKVGGRFGISCGLGEYGRFLVPLFPEATNFVLRPIDRQFYAEFAESFGQILLHLVAIRPGAHSNPGCK